LRRPSLRPQLNQIRLWVRQGRTDAWIAHKLDISVEQLEQFKRDQGIDGEPASIPPPAFVEPPSPEPAALDELDEDEDEEPLDVDEGPVDEYRERDDEERGRERDDDRDDERDDAQSDGQAEPARRRRRGRRGGRRRKRTVAFEGTFDHGGDGYGLWLDPAVADDDVYAEHWAGHREITITVEADVIMIRRAGSSPD
jgi:hypothetical protein